MNTASYSIVLRENIDIATVNGQVKFRIQPLESRGDVEYTSAILLTVNIHRDIGIESAVQLAHFLLNGDITSLLAALVGGLEHTIDILAGKVVDRAIGYDDIGAGVSRVYIV